MTIYDARLVHEGYHACSMEFCTAHLRGVEGVLRLDGFRYMMRLQQRIGRCQTVHDVHRQRRQLRRRRPCVRKTADKAFNLSQQRCWIDI